MIVRFRLRFAPHDSQLLSSAMEEEALRHGLAAALPEQGLSLAAYGTISSASLTGLLLPQLLGSQSKVPWAGAASSRGHAGRPPDCVPDSQTAAVQCWTRRCCQAPQQTNGRCSAWLPASQGSSRNVPAPWQTSVGSPQVPFQRECCPAALCPARAASGPCSNNRARSTNQSFSGFSCSPWDQPGRQEVQLQETDCWAVCTYKCAAALRQSSVVAIIPA